MRILVVGKGSIGIRHAKIFYDLNCEVSFLRTNKSTLGNIFKYKFNHYNNNAKSKSQNSK